MYDNLDRAEQERIWYRNTPNTDVTMRVLALGMLRCELNARSLPRLNGQAHRLRELGTCQEGRFS